jgi:hypothetical protein
MRPDSQAPMTSWARARAPSLASSWLTWVLVVAIVTYRRQGRGDLGRHAGPGKSKSQRTPGPGPGTLSISSSAQDLRTFWHERGDDRALVGFAAGDPRWLLASVLVAPLPQAGERDREVAAFGGEPVLVALGPLAVGDAVEDSLFDEPVQPVGEDVSRDCEALLELVEATQPEVGQGSFLTQLSRRRV